MMYGETFTAATRHNTSCRNSKIKIIVRSSGKPDIFAALKFEGEKEEKGFDT